MAALHGAQAGPRRIGLQVFGQPVQRFLLAGPHGNHKNVFRVIRNDVFHAQVFQQAVVRIGNVYRTQVLQHCAGHVIAAFCLAAGGIRPQQQHIGGGQLGVLHQFQHIGDLLLHGKAVLLIQILAACHITKSAQHGKVFIKCIGFEIGVRHPASCKNSCRAVCSLTSAFKITKSGFWARISSVLGS